jgi:hypothetical protein
MSALDSDYNARILESELAGGLAVHIVKIVLVFGTPHTCANDINFGQNTRNRTIDNLFFEVGKVSPPRRTRIYDRCDTVAERKSIGINRVVSGVRIAFTRAGVNVRVNINQTRRDPQVLYIDRLQGILGVQVLRDSRYLPVLDGDITDAINAIPGIDDVATLKQKVIW